MLMRECYAEKDMQRRTYCKTSLIPLIENHFEAFSKALMHSYTYTAV